MCDLRQTSRVQLGGGLCWYLAVETRTAETLNETTRTVHPCVTIVELVRILDHGMVRENCVMISLTVHELSC